MNSLSKSAPKLALLAILAAYLIKQVALIRMLGTEWGTDPDSVAATVLSAKHFIANGLGPTAGLQYWPGYTWETPVQQIKDAGLYTHFFPGPEYMLTLVYWIFGVSDTTFQWSRILPMLHVLLPLLLVVGVSKKRIWDDWEWGAPIALGLFCFAPGFYYWSLNLHGHAYATLYLLVAFCIGLLLGDADQERQNRKFWLKDRFLYLALVVCGFGSIYMILTHTFIVCAAPMVGMLLHRNPVSPKRWILSGFFVGVGLILANAVHVSQVAYFLNSYSLAWLDQFGSAVERSQGSGHIELPSFITILGQYSDHVRAWFRVNSLHLLWLGLGMAVLSFSVLRVRVQMVTALLLAFVACSVWLFVFRSHAQAHPHLVPRIYQLVYVTTVLIGVRFVSEVVRARSKTQLQRS